MKSLALVAISVLTLSGDDDPPAGADLAKMKGRWESSIAGAPGQKFTLEVDGDRATITFQGGKGAKSAIKGKFKVDESTTPKSLDLIDFISALNQPIATRKAIYELDGDVLRMSIGVPGGPRPTTFEAGAKGDPGIQVWKRIKAD